MEGRPKAWPAVLFVAVVLSLAGLATVGPGFVSTPVPPAERPEVAQPSTDPSPVAVATPGAEGATSPSARIFDQLFLILSVLIGLAVAAVLGYLAYRGIRILLVERVQRREIESRRAEQPTDPDREAEQLQGAVRAGLADLDDGGDPRRAVIACWLRLEQVAAASGAGRLVGDTPADLVARLLARHRVAGSALEQLASAYRQARYAPAQVAEELATRARQALREIAAELGAPTGGTVAR